jgi:hypothetical protein
MFSPFSPVVHNNTQEFTNTAQKILHDLHETALFDTIMDQRTNSLLSAPDIISSLGNFTLGSISLLYGNKPSAAIRKLATEFSKYADQNIFYYTEERRRDSILKKLRFSGFQNTIMIDVNNFDINYMISNLKNHTYKILIIDKDNFSFSIDDILKIKKLAIELNLAVIVTCDVDKNFKKGIIKSPSLQHFDKAIEVVEVVNYNSDPIMRLQLVKDRKVSNASMAKGYWFTTDTII